MMPPDPDQPDDTRSEEDPGNRLLKELAHDAKIVAAYAARAGLLKSAALPDAIAGLNPEENLSWRDPSVVKLQTALSATILDLAPTTLHDLKGPGAPFKTEAMTRYSVAFVVSWAIIIFIVAWGTLSHNFGLSIRSSLEELKEDGTRVRIEELVRSVVSNTRTLDVTTIADGLVSGADSGSAGEAFTDFAVASAFLVHLDEARALDEKTYTTVSNATKFIEENIILRLIVSPIGTLQSFFFFGANQNQLQY